MTAFRTAASPQAGSIVLPAERRAELLKLAEGSASGFVAGLAASWVMDRFQDQAQGLFRPGPADGKSPGDPATVKAAERFTVLASGRGLPREDKDEAGSAVHYLVGAMAGSLYGAVVEVRPQAARWRGAAMGLAAATLIDQLAVPLAGFARPPWKYTVGTHLYGYASHLVFGMATEALRRTLRGPIAELSGSAAEGGLETRDWAVPLLLGLANGQRTMTPAVAVSITAAATADGTAGRAGPLGILSSPWTAAALGLAALGEYYVDIRPGVPARIAPMGLAARMAAGGLVGAATARPERRLLGAAIAAGGALAGAYISYRVRQRLARTFGHDRPVGLAEDALSLAGSLALAAYAAMRRNEAAPAAPVGRMLPIA